MIKISRKVDGVIDTRMKRTTSSAASTFPKRIKRANHTRSGTLMLNLDTAGKTHTGYGKTASEKWHRKKWHQEKWQSEKLEIMAPLVFWHILLDFYKNNYLDFSVYVSENKYMYMCIINFIIPSHTKNLRANQTIN